MDIQDHRRQRLAVWVASKGGHGAVVRDHKLSVSQASFLSQVINGYSFAERAARNMEQRLGMERGYLDGAEEDQPKPSDEEAALLAAFRALPHGSPARRELLAYVRGVAAGAGLGGFERPDSRARPEAGRGGMSALHEFIVCIRLQLLLRKGENPANAGTQTRWFHSACSGRCKVEAMSNTDTFTAFYAVSLAMVESHPDPGKLAASLRRQAALLQTASAVSDSGPASPAVLRLIDAYAAKAEERAQREA